MSTSEKFQHLTDAQLPGLIIVLTIAASSVFALTFLALHTAFVGVRALLNPATTPSRCYIFFKTQLGLYVACLLASNCLNGVAGLILAYWAAKKGVEEGPECTAQGALMQIANFATAYFTVAIAVHTFTSLVLRSRQRAWVGMALAGFGWLCSILVGVIPLVAQGKSGPIFGNDGFACGIRRVYPVPQFTFHLLPIFCASTFSAVLYSLIFLVLRGTLSFRRGVKIQLNPNQRWTGRVGTYEEYHRFIGAIARSMLWYPFAYVLFLMPYSITRLLDISGFGVHFRTNVFAYSCTFVLGLVNVCLLYNTFRVLGPAFTGLPSTRAATDVESFGTAEKLQSPVDSAVRSKSARAFPMPRQSRVDPAGPSRYPSGGASALTHTPQSSQGSGSLRLLIPQAQPGPIGFGHNSNPSVDSTMSRSTVGAASIGRAITPVAELNSHFVSEPEPALSQAQAGLRPLRMGATSRVRPPSAAPTIGLPPPPRPSTTRSPVSRQPSLDGPGPSAYAPRHVRQASSLSNSGRALPRVPAPLTQKASLSAVTVAPPPSTVPPPSAAAVPPPLSAVPPPSPSEYGTSAGSDTAHSPVPLTPAYPAYAPPSQPGYAQGRQPIRYYRS